jgi:RNA 3'-terminal phosphate cyclase (ATP)
MKSIRIDGAFGEGGGQVVRSSLALAALTGRPLEIINIRAGRKNPGLRPQHLTAVRAVAAICAAEVQGDELNSQRLIFRPGSAPAGGDYRFDVRDAARGGSAGATTLVAQAILLPLAFAGCASQVVLRGGTQVPWSPPFHYLRDVFLPAVKKSGLRAEASLNTWGWYPVGGGEFSLTVQPVRRLTGLEWVERGELPPVGVTGVAAVTNLPSHIPQRMADRAENVLCTAGIASQVQPLRERGPAAGAGIFLVADYSNGAAGFSALGRRGRPADKVAEEACSALLDHHAATGAVVDTHLTDQLILPLALAAGDSILVTSRITQHTLTNIHVVRQFLETDIRIEQPDADGGPTPASRPGGTIVIKGVGYHV